MEALPLQPGDIMAQDITSQLGLPNATLLQLTRSACAIAYAYSKMCLGFSSELAMQADVNGCRGQSPSTLVHCRRYGQALGAAGGLLVTYTLANRDPFNALDIGSLSLPLVFQVAHRCTCTVQYHPVFPDDPSLRVQKQVATGTTNWRQCVVDFCVLSVQVVW